MVPFDRFDLLCLFVLLGLLCLYYRYCPLGPFVQLDLLDRFDLFVLLFLLGLLSQ